MPLAIASLPVMCFSIERSFKRFKYGLNTLCFLSVGKQHPAPGFQFTSAYHHPDSSFFLCLAIVCPAIYFLPHFFKVCTAHVDKRNATPILMLYVCTVSSASPLQALF